MGVFLTGTVPARAQSAPKAAAIAVGGDNLTRLLWNNPDGSISVWRMNADTTVAAQYSYGPYPGWVATALAAGADSAPRVLYNHTADGQLSLWRMDPTANTFTQNTYGPYPGWAASAIAVGGNNAPRLLWNHTADGQMSLWNMNPTTSTFSQNTYGPYPGWIAGAVSAGPDNAPRILYNHTADGQMSLWRVDPTSAAFTDTSYGPFPGYTAIALAVDSGNAPHVLWTGPSSTVSLWKVAADGTYTHAEYPDPAGYSPVGLACGTGGDVRLLWNDGLGDAQVWVIAADGTYTAKTYTALLVASLALAPATVTGGNTSTATVTMNSPAPAGGAMVTLTSSNAAATVPASVLVAAGATSAIFSVTTTAVTTSTIAVIQAKYNGKIAGTPLTINPSSTLTTLSLAAAATGANKITLYWNGIASASGYNVYRSTVSGGPYSLIASNVTAADPGPGMTGNFMYSDTAGLVTGTEYFYVVWAVQSGAETVQSNEASDIPQAGAVPWDTGDPVQILNAETTQLNAVLPPDIDPDTGEFVSAQVGLLTVQGPNGVIYESADTEGDTEGDPVTSYAAPGSYDSANNQLVLSDGETIPVPVPDTPPTGINNPNALTPLLQPAALPQNFQQDFNHQFDPSLGIEREILSLPGYVGLSSTELIFPCPATTPGNVQLNPSGPKGELDSADVYTGGFINGVYNTELDAGLVLTSSDASKDPAWQPVAFNYFDHHYLVTPGRPKAVTVNGQTLTGFERVLLYGDASSPLQLKFVTGGANPASLQGQVALNYRGQYQKITRAKDRSIIGRGAKLTGWVTLVAPQPQWKWKNRNSMIIKRVSSIAQNIPAKQPQQQNGSFMYGGVWGGDGSIDQEGQLLKAGQGYVDWDQTPTWLAGGYPFPGTGYLYFVAQIPYHWENHINLSTSYNSLLSIY